MKQVDFYFDFISPYAWLAAHEFKAVRAATGAEFRFVPIVFAALLNHHGNIGPAEIPTKRKYTILDSQRWASFLGLKCASPPAHPFNSLLPLRMTTAISDPSNRERFSCRVLDLAWSEGKDITDGPTLVAAAKALSLPGDELFASAQSDAVKLSLRRATEEAIAREVFGVPSFVVDGEVFWGHDRLSLLQAHLLGKLSIDKAHVANIIARPAAAQRKRPS